ncbi:hypothetical protein [Methylobacterium tarhaniae]|uniref:hypothetical protein n=1 Tax=Methylobacterium tarhaniae TaxID=1187852 RepID=UPI003D070E3C
MPDVRKGGQKLEIEIRFDVSRVEISVNNDNITPFDRGIDIGEADEIRYSEDAIFVANDDLDEGSDDNRLVLKAENLGRKIEYFAGKITSCDVQHIAGWIEFGGNSFEHVQLTTNADANVCRWQIENKEQYADKRITFYFYQPGGSHLRDGETVQLCILCSPFRFKLDEVMISSKIIGGLDRVTSRYVAGWAWNPIAQSNGLNIEILVNDGVIGTTVANRSRPDLEKFNPALSECGFYFPLPYSVQSGVIGRAVLSARVAGTEALLAGSDWLIMEDIGEKVQMWISGY